MKKLSVVKSVPVGRCVYMKDGKIITDLPLTENPKDHALDYDTMLVSPADAERLGYTTQRVH